ncbi:hypothetical protein EVAR_16191_1 [Eumeta japonica]|uniref:Uncharacterized protein n=1 Tax=Eumeta variegata TaxID=151549 RepID=A0A4C1WDI6_EUMVA|nr:hypothetical protein EVAR_16191_1 [Eumeta japonica]
MGKEQRFTFARTCQPHKRQVPVKPSQRKTFDRTRTTSNRSWGHPVKDPEEMSGSERLRKQIQAEKETKTAKRKS